MQYLSSNRTHPGTPPARKDVAKPAFGVNFLNFERLNGKVETVLKTAFGVNFVNFVKFSDTPKHPPVRRGRTGAALSLSIVEANESAIGGGASWR
jgi:hypothetical protein